MFNINSKNKRIFVSLTALMLIVALAVGFTYGWSEGGERGFVSGNNITISTGSNLTMRQNDMITSSIILPACTLKEASSVDGRNIFFPLGDNTTSDTSTMTFREGTPSDVNQNYICVDFELEAGEKPVDVYMGAGTIIQCKNKELLSALRLAFYYNDGSDPLVFKPNQMPGVEMSFSPISTIVPVTGSAIRVGEPVVTEAFGSYYYKGDDKSTPLFALEKEETKHISLAIWLEGTEFTTADIANQDLDIYIDFTTTVDDLIKYTFIDNCHSRNSGELNQWVSNNMWKDVDGDGINDVSYPAMIYLYDKTAERYYALEKVVDETDESVDTHTWVGYIPKTINNFYFQRYSIDIDEWWNEWEPTMTGIPTYNSERTFVAIAGQTLSEGTNLDGCYGYWKDASDIIRIYFQMECAWTDLHCYAWDGSTENLGTWPGSPMNFVKNVNGYPLYYVDIPGGSTLDGVIFNNGDSKSIVYFEKNYGLNTAAYVHGASPTAEPLGAWPGTGTVWDDGRQMNKIEVTGTKGSKFNVIVNNGYNNSNGSTEQCPSSGDGKIGYIGKSYIFKDNGYAEMEEVKLEYKIEDTQYFYNGSLFIYKNDSNKSMMVYTDEESSLIYPVNDPTP